MLNRPVSPITRTEQVTLLSTLQSHQLIEDWKKDFGIDILKHLDGYEEIQLYECNQSKLLFFTPTETAGSDKLYEQLEKFDWYYMPRKWEHDVAVQDLSGSQRVLELGSGRGGL